MYSERQTTKFRKGRALTVAKRNLSTSSVGLPLLLPQPQPPHPAKDYFSWDCFKFKIMPTAVFQKKKKRCILFS